MLFRSPNPNPQTPLHRSIFVSRRIIIPIMDKRVLPVVFVIVALLSRPGYAQITPRSWPVTQLDFKSVQLPNVIPPANAASSCGGLWKREGQACDLTRLTAYSKSEDNKIDAMLVDLKNMVNEFHSRIKRVNYQSVTSLTEDEKLYFKIWSDPLMVSKYHNDAATCWKEMKSKRSSSLCSACSGQYSKYFIWNKAVIDEKVCDVMLDSCLNFFSDSLDIPIGVQAIKKVFLSNPFTPSFTRTTQVITKESTAARFVGLTDKFMVDMETLKIRDLIHDRKKSDKTSDKFKQASVKLCDYFIRIRKEPLLVPIIRIMKFMVPGAQLAVNIPASGANPAIMVYMQNNALKALDVIEGVAGVVDNGDGDLNTSPVARNTLNLQNFNRNLIAMLRPKSQVVRAMSASRSLASGDTAATSLFKDVPKYDLFNGDVVILRNTGLSATIDGSSGSIAESSFGKTTSMDFGYSFP